MSQSRFDFEALAADEWKKANSMVCNLPRIRNENAKRLQKSLICQQWIKALKGGRRG